MIFLISLTPLAPQEPLPNQLLEGLGQIFPRYARGFRYLVNRDRVPAVNKSRIKHGVQGVIGPVCNFPSLLSLLSPATRSSPEEFMAVM